MATTGGRASMGATYAASGDLSSGVISSVEIHANFDGGCNRYVGDVSMATSWSDNCYRHADYDYRGSALTSATPGQASCRAPGVIQSQPVHELILERAAEVRAALLS